MDTLTPIIERKKSYDIIIFSNRAWLPWDSLVHLLNDEYICNSFNFFFLRPRLSKTFFIALNLATSTLPKVIISSCKNGLYTVYTLWYNHQIWSWEDKHFGFPFVNTLNVRKLRLSFSCHLSCASAWNISIWKPNNFFVLQQLL